MCRRPRQYSAAAFQPLFIERFSDLLSALDTSSLLPELQNPHIHLIGTRELVDTKTGEVHDVTFINYNKIRHIWAGLIATSCRCAGRFASCCLKKAFLNHLKKHKIITAEEFEAIDEKFSNGFAAPRHLTDRMS